MIATPSYLLRNARIVVPLAVVQTLIYAWLNHRATPLARTLPLTAADEWIPFLPWTVWPYLGLIAAAFVLPLFIRRPAVFRQVLVAYALAIGSTFLCFAVFPTMYERMPYACEPGWTAAAYAQLLAFDTPLCCFPSGHVVTPLLGCWGLCRDGRRGAGWLTLGLAACSLSILTTKQHYLWDWLGAMLVVSVAVAIALRVAPDASSSP